MAAVASAFPDFASGDSSDLGSSRSWSSDGLVGLELEDPAGENATANVWNTWIPSTSLPVGLFVEGEEEKHSKPSVGPGPPYFKGESSFSVEPPRTEARARALRKGAAT